MAKTHTTTPTAPPAAIPDYMGRDSVRGVLEQDIPAVDREGIQNYVSDLEETLGYRASELFLSHTAALNACHTEEQRQAVKLAFAYAAGRMANGLAYSLVRTFEDHITGSNPFKDVIKGAIYIGI